MQMTRNSSVKVASMTESIVFRREVNGFNTRTGFDPVYFRVTSIYKISQTDMGKKSYHIKSC